MKFIKKENKNMTVAEMPVGTTFLYRDHPYMKVIGASGVVLYANPYATECDERYLVVDLISGEVINAYEFGNCCIICDFILKEEE